MNRIIVVGTTGSGKSTLAARLARRLGCPFLELDALFWNPGWVRTPPDEFRARVAAAIAPEHWTAGGNYGSARDLIWRRADTLVWLDYPFPIVFARLFRRTLRRIITQEELWNGNRESFRAHFLSRDSLFIWQVQSHWHLRRTFAAELDRPDYAHLAVHRFRTPSQADDWLNVI